MSKIILGFVGEMAGGKGTACDYLINNYQAGYHRFSSILRDLLDRLHEKHSRHNMQQLSTALRQSMGEDILAKVMAKEVETDKTKIICVDGIRRPADIEYLKQLPNFHLVYLTAEEKTRYERIIQRAENSDDQKKTFEQFKKDQAQECETTIKEVAAEAEHTIKNDGSVAELQQQIDELLNKYK